MKANYMTESLVPGWLADDHSYRDALKQWLVNMMHLQDYEIIDGPYTQWVRVVDAQVPVGCKLIRAYCTVNEFIDV